jgi:hypothetical protein
MLRAAAEFGLTLVAHADIARMGLATRQAAANAVVYLASGTKSSTFTVNYILPD